MTTYHEIRHPIASSSGDADRLVKLVQDFATECYIAMGENVAEIWVGQKTYDALSLAIHTARLRRYETEEERQKQDHLYRNGKIVIMGPVGAVTVRVK